MAKATIMLAMIRKKTEELEKDCVKFDEKENLHAGMRIRGRLKKIRKMINNMIADTLETSNTIKKKRGYKPPSYYWAKYKADGRMEKWKKNAKKTKVKKFQNPQENKT